MGGEPSLYRVPHLKADKSSQLCREPRCHGVFYHPSINQALRPCLFIMSTRTRRRRGALHMHHVNLSISLPNLNNFAKVSLCSARSPLALFTDTENYLSLYCLSAARHIERGFCCILSNVFKHAGTPQNMWKAYVTLFLSLAEMRWQVMRPWRETPSLPPSLPASLYSFSIACSFLLP